MTRGASFVFLMAATSCTALLSGCGPFVFRDNSEEDDAEAAALRDAGVWPAKCDVPVSAGDEKQYFCLEAPEPGGSCPTLEDGFASEELVGHTDGETCADTCCTWTEVLEVLCGPDPTVPKEWAAPCCYHVRASTMSNCGGSPSGDPAEDEGSGGAAEGSGGAGEGAGGAGHAPEGGSGGATEP